MAFVVIDKVVFSIDNLLKISEKSLRTKGSPPVSLILLTPLVTNSFAISKISLAFINFAEGVRGTPDAGIQ
jgi:hypothetical protein